MTATSYEIDITMDQETVTALLAGNYGLYGFKAVRAEQADGHPLVWFTLSGGYSLLTKLAWSDQYEAYTSHSSIIPGGEVKASLTAEIGLGQILEVGPGGIGQVKNGGTAQTISLLNTTNTQFTCGIGQRSADGSNNPVCAFPLYGQQSEVIAPIKKVLLMFSTVPVSTGTVIAQAFGPGVLIDLTSASERTVTYDVDTGWSWDGSGWGQAVAANENLVPLLIERGDASWARSFAVHAGHS